MTIRRSALAVAVVLGFAAPALAQGRAGLSGVWAGYYGYDGQANTVQFQAKLAAAGGAFSGGTIEPNTFGDPGVLFLTANVAGAVDAAGKVSFKKTYDGTGGQSHSVQYAGAYDQTGACITGTWRVDGAAGPFKMCAVAKPNS